MEAKSKKRLEIVLKGSISIALIVALVIFADVRKIASALYNFSWIWLIPVFFFIFLSVAVSALKWQVLLAAQRLNIGWWRLFQYYTSGFFFNNFLPSSVGCDGIRIYLVKNETGSYSQAASSVVMERVIATITLSLLGLVSAAFATVLSTPAVLTLTAVFLVGFLLFAIQLTGYTPQKIRDASNKFSSIWKNFAASSAELRKHPKNLLVCFLESLLFQIFVAFVVGAVMYGLNLPRLSFADLFYISSAASVLAMVPIGVNGYGLREGGYIFLLAPLGFQASGAFAISILFAVFVSIYSLLGAVFWVWLKRASPAKVGPVQ
jgi:uncharacterized protein (TIRG00374 family)